ncbi:MAG: bacteriohemerythrin [Bdellovibrionales bacterium]
MLLIEWKDNYSVHVQSIDAQHKKLISYINELYDSMIAQETKEKLGGILDELASYTEEHFSFEEKYFEEFNYLGKFSHMVEHKAFVDKIVDFKKKFDAGALMLSTDVMNFLRDWLTNHIMGTDKKYSSFFNEHGMN